MQIKLVGIAKKMKKMLFSLKHRHTMRCAIALMKENFHTNHRERGEAFIILTSGQAKILRRKFFNEKNCVSFIMLNFCYEHVCMFKYQCQCIDIQL